MPCIRHGAGLLFCPATIQPHTSVYSGLYSVHASYTDHAAKQRTRLYRRFSCDLTHSTAHDTRPTQAAIIPPVPRWSVSQRRSTSSTYQILAPRRTLYRSAQPPYCNKVYKGAPLLWIHARQCSKSQTMPARRGGSLASTAPGAPAEGSTSPPVQGQPGGMDTAGGAEPLTALAASLFGLSPDS